MFESIVYQRPDYQIKVKKSECLAPKGIYAITISNQQKNQKNEIIQSSNYEFFMDQQQINSLIEVLSK